ncbi:MAG: hypothetical protein JNM79_05290 [Burkholderiales bacterium]|nr:hypothetical protein [Burkholderiales bacterium]
MNARSTPAAALAEQPGEWVARARALVPLLDAAGPRIDSARALPADVQDALFDSRLFRLLLPASLDGIETDFVTFFRVISTLAEGDASAAWCVAQSCGGSMSAAYMAPQAAHEVFAAPRANLAWGFAQAGCTAREVPGGWQVSGTWGFGSGSRHATWLGGHCQVQDAAGRPRKDAQGRALERTMLMRRETVNIVDGEWNVIGLRGTGSDTYAVKDMFVPAEYAIPPRAIGRDLQLPADAVAEPEPERRETGTLYRFASTVAFQSGFSAVALGVARGTLDALINLAQSKAPSPTGMRLAENVLVQVRVAQAEARLRSAHAWIIGILEAMWEECARTGRHSFEHRVQIRLASTWAMQEARRVVEDAYAEAGATAIFAANPFERRMRDMQAVAQQVQAQTVHLQSAGQHYLGIAPSTRFL